MDAEDPDLAHVRIRHHLENVGQHMLLGIRLGLERLGDIAGLTLVERRQISFQRIRRQRGQHMQQLLDAGARLGGNEQNRNQMTFAQRLSNGACKSAGLGSVPSSR